MGIFNPGYLIERKRFCPRWFFWRLKTFWPSLMTRTEIKHDDSILMFLRGGPLGSELDLIAPGVRGKLFPQESKKRIRVAMIFAECEGNGDVGRWLDQLSPAHVIMCVTSDILLGMLLRRGWIPTWEKEADGFIDVWVHPSTIKVRGDEMQPRMRLYDDWERELKARKVVKAMAAGAGR